MNIYSLDCTTHRRRELSKNNSLLLVPECNEDGSYKDIQCFPPSIGGKRFCQCWNKDGQILSSPSTKTKACSCISKREETKRSIPPREASSAPSNQVQCEDDGRFKKLQCSGPTGSASSCYCVNPNTGVKTNTPPVNNVCA